MRSAKNCAQTNKCYDLLLQSLMNSAKTVVIFFAAGANENGQELYPD